MLRRQKHFKLKKSNFEPQGTKKKNKLFEKNKLL